VAAVPIASQSRIKQNRNYIQNEPTSDALKTKWEEAAIICFKIPNRTLSGFTQENHENVKIPIP
jgi:hypothetical protein